ncbi:hypothetical protein [Sinomonas halotolerans]|uniref:Uncharacterized protein n=1 Tax=Sinomonas halotolerans TaxID=1644133 RepID=A0ABU9X2H8_9MICC
MLEFSDGGRGTDPEAELTFDDPAELNDYLDSLDVDWFEGQEVVAALKNMFGKKIHSPFVEQIVAWVEAWRWKHYR